uniref:2Fe-2S ferredoxin-type domain-containing protein n=2 Tax=Leptocylindrus danicus TaxID=163516 RepID=A0A7S2NS42_9STRA|mmetsp:Transcript_1150/g.1648  ORF Transcript_1150/g.1648 Transcript_1150/m.1648 type:complete len:163 (+) Transcript_1150:62-550(+)
MKSPPLIITTTIALQGTSCIVQSFQIHSTSCCSYTHAQTQREAAARYYGDDNDDIFSQRQRQRQRTSMNDGLRYQDDDDNEDLTKQFMTQVSLDELEERTNVARPASSGDSLNKVPVKFVNFDSQNPYDFRTALVEKGMNLMDVADDLGVPVPRSCKSGLCG